MGIFTKLFGRDQDAHEAAPTAAVRPRSVAGPAPAPATPPAGLVRLSATGRMSVVGESHYQPALKAAAGGRVARGDFENAIPVEAVLIPEPGNKHDRNAVRVDVLGRTVGHLAREDAVRYQPVLLPLMRDGKAGWCPARIMGGGDRYYGIWLHLSEPSHLICANDPADMELLEADRSVTVTGEENHQTALEQAAGGRIPAPVFAALGACSVAKGKYAGEPTLEVLVNGHRVGELTKAMGDRYAPHVRAAEARGQTAGCEAVIENTDRGYQVELKMPRS